MAPVRRTAVVVVVDVQLSIPTSADRAATLLRRSILLGRHAVPPEALDVDRVASTIGTPDRVHALQATGGRPLLKAELASTEGAGRGLGSRPSGAEVGLFAAVRAELTTTPAFGDQCGAGKAQQSASRPPPKGLSKTQVR